MGKHKTDRTQQLHEAAGITEAERDEAIELMAKTAGEAERAEQGPIGWLCPACGRGIAPWQSVCSCGPKVQVISAGSTDG